MKKRQRIILIVVIILLILILIYPKDCGYSAGGLLAVNMTVHSEKCSCLGIKYSLSGSRFGFMQCVDCGPSYYCVGIPISKKCYEGTFQISEGTEWEEIECRKG